MIDLVRDAALGQLLRLISPKLAPYPDERPDYVVPPKYLVGPSGTATPAQKRHSGDGGPAMTRGSSETLVTGPNGEDPEKGPKDEAPQKPKAIVGPSGEKYVLVDWDGPDDPERPMFVVSFSCVRSPVLTVPASNWSSGKKRFFVAQIMLLTFAVYIGSAIYTSSIPGIMEHFGVSQVRATWGMTLFIFACKSSLLSCCAL